MNPIAIVLQFLKKYFFLINIPIAGDISFVLKGYFTPPVKIYLF